MSTCAVCKQPATQKCGGCHSVYYCDKQHQRQDWKQHKHRCRPFKVCEDEVLGRHLLATRDINPGDIVLKEPVLIWGPSQITIPVCLGCGRGINEDDSKPCSKCGWPVCSQKCEDSDSHRPECYYTSQAGKKVSIRNFELPHPNYQCLTVLRCLYQKQFDEEKWKKLDVLQSHCEERRNTEKYESDRFTIAKFIRSFFKLDAVFSEEDILKVCGLVMVNGHEIPLTEPPHVAIYESTSMFEHSCKANCSKSFTSAEEVLISASVSIKKGQHLSICYTDSLWGTPNRRHHLQQTKFFWCSCERCMDPTEFGTFFSAIRCKCKENCKGYMLPDSFVSSTEEPPWKCKDCKGEVPPGEVQILLEELGRKLEGMEKGKSKACKAFLAEAGSMLHSNHYYLTDVKIALSQLIGQEFKGGLPQVSDEDLELKAGICKKLYDLVETLAPAEKRIRGILMFELHAAVTEMGRRTASSGGDPEALHVALAESKKMLVQVVELLKHEPQELPEGRIGRQAVTNLKEIEVILRTVHERIGDSPA